MLAAGAEGRRELIFNGGRGAGRRRQRSAGYLDAAAATRAPSHLPRPRSARARPGWIDTGATLGAAQRTHCAFLVYAPEAAKCGQWQNGGPPGCLISASCPPISSALPGQGWLNECALRCEQGEPSLFCVPAT